MQTLEKSGLWEIKKVLRSLSFILLFLSLKAFAITVKEPKDLLDLKNRGDFLSHEEWLGISFPVSEIHKIKKEIEEQTGEKLFSLSDSYLLVITTQEWAILKTTLKMTDIEKLFTKFDLNKVNLKPECVAKLEGAIGDQTFSQWALILKQNNKIKDFRRDLRRLFRAKGGLGDDFQVERWKPLLVLGFSSREFFDHDGLFKSNQAKCVFNF